MSVQAMVWAFSQIIPPGPKLVLLAIANEANAVGGHAFPSLVRVAKHASMSVRSVQRHVKWLEKNKLIERQTRTRKDGGRSSDDYVLCLPPPGDNLSPAPGDTGVTTPVTMVSPHIDDPIFTLKTRARARGFNNLGKKNGSFKPRAMRWADVRYDYEQRYGKKEAFKRYTEDVEKGN